MSAHAPLVDAQSTRLPTRAADTHSPRIFAHVPPINAQGPRMFRVSSASGCVCYSRYSALIFLNIPKQATTEFFPAAESRGSPQINHRSTTVVSRSYQGVPRLCPYLGKSIRGHCANAWCDQAFSSVGKSSSGSRGIVKFLICSTYFQPTEGTAIHCHHLSMPQEHILDITRSSCKHLKN